MIFSPEKLARIEHSLRGLITSALSPRHVVALYSSQRNKFLKSFFKELPSIWTPPKELSRTLWGLQFRSPLFNASGIFKNGEGYELCFRQGAGAYLAGTVTALPRAGNAKIGIKLPFAPYPCSHAASNWLGLPNDGDAVVTRRIAALSKYDQFPIGVSIMGAPELEGQDRLKRLLESLRGYYYAGADFIELNESCPNTEAKPTEMSELLQRLRFISTEFLQSRSTARPFPIIVKFSTDTSIETLPELLGKLVEFGFDGVNFGNTSTDYTNVEKFIDQSEQKLFRYFTTTFGGGVSGLPLRDKSLRLVRESANILKKISPANEFHIIRTGGVESWSDVELSLLSGASLVQWYTGYFEAFSRFGYGLYEKLILDSKTL